MPRTTRIDVGDVTYHVINRANARMKIFDTDEDNLLFEKTLKEAREKFDMRILAYCVMPNHWHLILYPKKDGDLQKFMGWLSMAHTQRWHSEHNTTGSGHLYQGRYKSFLVQKNRYLLQLFRYVERNALRAKLVKRAEDWKWTSLYRREKGGEEQKKLLAKWPIDMPKDYLGLVNEPHTNTELESLRYCVNKGKPFGNNEWTGRMIDAFKLESTLRGRGRPKKGS